MNATGPGLLTFDIFGTVIDWRRGLRESLRRHGAQAALEQGPFRPYASIVGSSLIRALGIPPTAAHAIGAEAGTWPLYPDAREALRRMRRGAPCVATTNSDQSHGRQAQRALGFDLDGWITAEEIRCYKPDPAFWRHVASRRSVALDRSWWHVSAYGDYDLETARGLGLTCVYVARPHARFGPADLYVRDLAELAVRVGDPGPAVARR